MLADAGRPREGTIASLLGLGALLFAAIGVVVQLKDALNTVWEVEETPGHGTWHFIRSYVVSLAAVMALGFLLLVSLMVTAGLAGFSKYAAPHTAEWLLHLISSLVSLAVIALLFAMMFKWLPDAAIEWYDVWLGAVLTALLFEIGKSAIAFYIGKQGLESTYGAAASIIVVLIWVYYTSQIILMGAEVTHAFATHHGSIKARSEDARAVATPERTKVRRRCPASGRARSYPKAGGPFVPQRHQNGGVADGRGPWPNCCAASISFPVG